MAKVTVSAMLPDLYPKRVRYSCSTAAKLEARLRELFLAEAYCLTVKSDGVLVYNDETEWLGSEYLPGSGLEFRIGMIVQESGLK